MRKFLLLFFAVAMTFCGRKERVYEMNLASPDGVIDVVFDVNADGEFFYSVNHAKRGVIGHSKLGLEVDKVRLEDGFEIIDQVLSSKDSTWTKPWGENKTIVDKHKGTVFSLRHKATQKQINVEFRVFNDAVAFRYCFVDGGAFLLTDELSQINVLDNPTAWYSVADFNTYESKFLNSPLDSVALVATPIIMRRGDGVHVAINEATILNYPDATLKNLGKGVLKVELVPWSSGEKARINAPFCTPWRVIQIADNAKGIIANQTLLNLAPAQKQDSVSYCQPMTYVGIWWDYHLGTKEWKEGPRQGATTYEALRAIDFAFRNNIGGVVIEGWNSGWNNWGQVGAFDYTTPAKGYDLKQVAEYAKTCGVKLIMHHETGGDIKGYEARMDSAFMLCQELGITALKTGHAGEIKTGEFHHGQELVEHFEKIVQTAAKYNISLDMHEATKGSGLDRTYPNIMTREAVRGGEWEAWSDGNMPSHTVMIPFTRGLSGATDYTPGFFDILYKSAYGRKAWNTDPETFKKARVHSTLAHQLSLMVTIYSPWVMAADRIDVYDGHPAFKFVSELNPDYDQTIVLDAVVGEYIVVARRTGDVWYIGATNNENKRDISIPLTFLGDGKFNATIYKDGKNADWEKHPTDYKIEKQEVTPTDTINLTLASGGGAAIVIKK